MNVADQARDLVRTAEAHRERQEWPQARAAVDAAIGLSGGAPEVYALRGLIGVQQGRPDEARRDYERALAGYRAAGEQRGPYLAAALDGLGQAYTKLGDPHRAVAALREAVAMKRGRDQPTSLAISLGNLSLALQADGDLDGAGHALGEAADLPGLADDLRGGLEQERAHLLMSRGLYAQARVVLAARRDQLVKLEQAKRLSAPSVERAVCLGNLGATYAELDDYENARRSYRESVEIREIRTPDSVLLANALANLAGVLDDPAEAEPVLRRAIALAERHAPGSVSLANARAHLAGLLVDRGDPRAALRQAEQAITDGPTRANALLIAAMAHLDLGDPAAAASMAQRAYDVTASISRRHPDLRPIHTVLGGLARRRHDRDTAIRHFDEAITIAERVRVGAHREPGLERSFGNARDAYHGRIDLSYERKKPGDARQAFAAAEAFRARTLADLLATADPGRTVAADPAQHRLGEIYRELDPSGPEIDAVRAGELRAERSRLEAQAEDDRLRLLAREPEEADRRFPAPATVPEIQAVLEPGTTLALYEVTDTHAYLFLVARNSFSFRRLAPSATELRGAVDLVLDACRDDDSTPPHGALGRLAEWLTPSLRSVTGRLIVCADATLAYFPFEALPGLPESCVVSYTPSATTLVRFGHRHRRAPVRELTGFAVESLPGQDHLLEAADEIRDAADRLGGRNKCFFGGKATVPAVRKYAPGSRYVHFAAHSVINDEHPLHSGIPMSDGFLHAFQMFSLGLAADVVVLSACRTAVGQARPGEGVVGLSRALFAAGARAVLLTRWKVNSLTTTIVMNAFYEGLARGRTPAHALAAGIRKVRNDRPTVFEHPREWAAFFLLDTHAGG